jgi:cytochrome c553
LLQRGRALALRGDAQQGLPACVQCHGTALTGVAPHVPGLLGLPRDYLNAQLGGWRTGERKAHAPDCMATIAKRLTPTDVASVAAWLSTQAVPAVAKPILVPPTSATLAPVQKMDLACGSAPELSGEARP